MKIDLHNHSTYSDGLYTPKELLAIAEQQQVDIFALTDHDSVFGCEEILQLSKNSKVKVICGMELSTEYKNKSVHIVCLFKDNKVPKKFMEFSLAKREERKQRAILMMKKIEEIYHLKINLDRLLEESKIITRANMLYNICECNHLTQKEADPYISSSSKAYIPSTKLSTIEGIQMLKDSGCLTFLAHPCLLPRDMVEEVIQMGVDGIEARYPKNGADDEAYFTALAKKYHLLISAGSDFHGDGIRHAMMGTSCLNESEFKPIQERLGSLW